MSLPKRRSCPGRTSGIALVAPRRGEHGECVVDGVGADEQVDVAGRAQRRIGVDRVGEGDSLDHDGRDPTTVELDGHRAECPFHAQDVDHASTVEVRESRSLFVGQLDPAALHGGAEVPVHVLGPRPGQHEVEQLGRDVAR